MTFTVGGRRADGTWTTAGDLERTVIFAPETPEETEVTSAGSYDGYLGAWLF